MEIYLVDADMAEEVAGFMRTHLVAGRHRLRGMRGMGDF